MNKAKLIGGVIGTSALLTAILCGCCGCDCNQKCKAPKCDETAQIIVIAPPAEKAPACPCKMCQTVRQQIKRMKKSEVLAGAQHHPKVKRDKAQCADSQTRPMKKAQLPANNAANNDDVVSESFSIIAVEAVPDAPAAQSNAAPAKPAAPVKAAPAAPQSK